MFVFFLVRAKPTPKKTLVGHLAARHFTGRGFDSRHLHQKSCYTAHIQNARAGISSVGRAPAFQAGGTGSNPVARSKQEASSRKVQVARAPRRASRKYRGTQSQEAPLHFPPTTVILASYPPVIPAEAERSEAKWPESVAVCAGSASLLFCRFFSGYITTVSVSPHPTVIPVLRKAQRPGSSMLLALASHAFLFVVGSGAERSDICYLFSGC